MRVTPWHLLREAVWKRDAGLCWRCDEPAGRQDFHLDEVTPASEGGRFCMDNLRVAHSLCNRIAGGKLGARRRWHDRPDNLNIEPPRKPCRECIARLRAADDNA